MKKKVAIQGILGSFHNLAARKFFKNEDIEILNCRNFREVCESLEHNQVDYSVMAIENTIAGSLLNNYALLREYHLKIIGETYLHIQMSLLANKGVKIEDIELVHSHPIALRQCADYLDSMPNIKLVEKTDTASAAKELKEKELKNVAAVAHRENALLYDLAILVEGIETNKRNYTRFYLLSREGINNEKNNKASICFELGHKIGALAKVLNILTECKINMTKIQSVPLLGKPKEYSFNIDLEWKNYQNYEDAIHQILKEVSNLSILGEYKKAILKYPNGF